MQVYYESLQTSFDRREEAKVAMYGVGGEIADVKEILNKMR